MCRELLCRLITCSRPNTTSPPPPPTQQSEQFLPDIDLTQIEEDDSLICTDFGIICLTIQVFVVSIKVDTLKSF